MKRHTITFAPKFVAKSATALIAILFLSCSFAHAQMDKAYQFYNKGNALFFAKKQKEAVLEFDKAIALNPKIKYIYAQRGISYHQLKDFDKAIADYKKDEAVYPAHSSYNMACVLSILGKKEEAFKWLEISQKSEFRQLQKTVQEDVDFENIKKDARFAKIVKTDYRSEYEKIIAEGDAFYYDTKDYKAAVASFEKAINKEPKNPIGYRARGNSYMSLNDVDKANKDFDKAIELKDKEAWYCYLGKAGMVSKTDGKFAFQYYQKVYELNPAWEGNFDVAVTYFINGKKEEAIAICQQFGDNYNDTESLAYTAYFMYNKGGQDALAMEYCDKALLSDPKFSLAYEIRAGLNFQMKKYDACIADYTKAIEYNPNGGLAYYRRGTAKAELKRKTEACADWKKAISLGYKDENDYYEDLCK